MNVAPEQIIIGAGTEYLYGLLLQLLGFGKKYAVEDPGYSKISQELLLKLEQSGVKLSSLSQYYQAPPDTVKHIFIINYSFVSEDNMEKAVELIYCMLF